MPLPFTWPRHGEQRRAGIPAPTPITRHHFLKSSAFIIFICQLFCANILFPLASFTLTPPPPPFLFLFRPSQEIWVSTTLQQGTTGLGKSRTGTKPLGNQTGQRGDPRGIPRPSQEKGSDPGHREAGGPAALRQPRRHHRQPTAVPRSRPRKEPRSSGPAAARQRCPALRFCPALPASSRRKRSLRQSCTGLERGVYPSTTAQRGGRRGLARLAGGPRAPEPPHCPATSRRGAELLCHQKAPAKSTSANCYPDENAERVPSAVDVSGDAVSHRQHRHNDYDPTSKLPALRLPREAAQNTIAAVQ